MIFKMLSPSLVVDGMSYNCDCRHVRQGSYSVPTKLALLASLDDRTIGYGNTAPVSAGWGQSYGSIHIEISLDPRVYRMHCALAVQGTFVFGNCG